MVFERAKATATRLIDKYGQDCTWRQTVAAGGTEAKPASTVPTDHPCKIVFVSPKLERLASALSMFVGTDIPSGMVVGLMANVPFTPTLADVVFRSKFPLVTGEQYGIADENGIEVIAPNDEGVILYKVRLVR